MPEAAVPREREVKLQAAPGFHLPDLDGVLEGVHPGPEEDARLETTYWDTRDLRLARWGVSLRHRGGQGWTLKLPGSSDGRLLSRPELAFPGPGRRIPPEVTLLIRAYVRGTHLEPVARLSTWRRRVPLLDEHGRQVAEVVDDEVSVLDGRRVAARFREVEVELGEGGEAILDPLIWRLRAYGAGHPDPTPKHVRAMGPAALLPPEVTAQPLGLSPTAAEVIRNSIAEAVELIIRHDAGIRLGGDPEDVHQARVGTRRLRSNLRTFRPLLEPEWAAGLDEELRWLGAEFGLVRDQEVLYEQLEAHGRRLPPADRRTAHQLTESLRQSVEAGRAELLSAMAGQRYAELIDRLVDAANHPVLNEAAGGLAASVLPPLARRPWRILKRAIEALGEDPPDPALHQCRIYAKRLRYAAEAVAPAAGPEAARLARAAAALQTVLGDHQDAVNAQVWLRRHSGTGRRAFVAGEMAALEMVRAGVARAAWPRVWRRLAQRRLREWMAA